MANLAGINEHFFYFSVCKRRLKFFVVTRHSNYWRHNNFFITLKYGVGDLSKKDAIALIIAFSGLYIWYLTQEATWALIIVILVDAIGSLLTILKTYKDPGSETASFWFLSGLSGLIAAISVGSWNFILLVYPVYFCLQSWAVLVSIYTSPNKFKNS